MWGMSRKQEVTTTGTSTSLGGANKFMVSTSHRLCWSIPWKNILYCGQCPFQVVGGHPSCFYFFSAGCSSVKTLIFNSWTSRGGSVRQRHSFYQCVEFQTCMKCNGIRHVRCAPYHPSSNGLAERVVQTFKEAMKKTKGDIDVLFSKISLPIQNHTTCDHRPVPSTITCKTSTQISIGPNGSRCWFKCSKESRTPENGS